MKAIPAGPRQHPIDLRVDSLSPDPFRVPVETREATIFLVDGSSHDVRLPVRPGAPIEQIFDSPEPFLPAHEGRVFRVYARAALTCVSVVSDEAPQDDSMARGRRELVVTLSSGLTVGGVLHFVAVEGRTRLTDVLNEDTGSFALQSEARTVHIAKAHVLSVEERS